MSWLDRLRRKRSKPFEDRLLFYTQQPLEDSFYAVIRITWFNNGKAWGVTEGKIDCFDADVVMEFTDIVGNALRSGADVSVICIDDPMNLGIHET